MDTPKDLHIQKASHLSVPVDANVEIHMRRADVEKPGKVGDHVIMGIPMIVTSVDDDSIRYKQEGKFIVGDGPTPSLDAWLEGHDNEE